MNQDAIRDGVNEAFDRARSAAGDLLDRGRSKVNVGTHHAAERAKDVYDEALHTLERRARDRPLPAVALALGVGFLIGLLAVRR